jgi:hypothetical protein
VRVLKALAAAHGVTLKAFLARGVLATHEHRRQDGTVVVRLFSGVLDRAPLGDKPRHVLAELARHLPAALISREADGGDRASGRIRRLLARIHSDTDATALAAKAALGLRRVDLVEETVP